MEQQSDMAADVVVIGAGLAGLCAALSASDLGAQVVIVEKADAPGGSTLWSFGTFSLAGTDEQATAGIPDDEDALRRDLLKAGGGHNNLEQVDLYVSEQRATYRWLKELGVRFAPPILGGGQSLARSHATDVRLLIDALVTQLKRSERVQWIDGATARQLNRSPDGVVTGVTIDQGVRTQTLHARRGVILATGGFARSDELVLKFAPELQKTKRMGAPGVTGDGLRMGWAVGGDVVDIGWMEGTFGALLPHYPSKDAWTSNDSILLLPMYAGGIIVNRDGKRFVDESRPYRKIGNACLEQPDAVAFQLFDQTVMDTSIDEPITRNFKAAFEHGSWIKSAPTAGAAAAAFGIDPATVEETVARYNRAVDTGSGDEFARTSLIYGKGQLVRLAKPPFYICACTTAIVATYAGLAANRRMQLLDVFGQVVPGVYVAGEVVGGLHGPNLVSGSGIAKAAIFGREAGREAARSAQSGR